VCAKEWRVEVRIGCGKEPWSLWWRAVGCRCGALEIAGLFGGGCLAGFSEGSGLISGAWGFAESIPERFEGFIGFGVCFGGPVPELSPKK